MPAHLLWVLIVYLLCHRNFVTAGPAPPSSNVTVGDGPSHDLDTKGGVGYHGGLPESEGPCYEGTDDNVSADPAAKTKALEDCQGMRTLDFTNAYLLDSKSVMYGGIVIRLPFDAEYIKMLGETKALKNSITSLVSSGMFLESAKLKVYFDIGYHISIKSIDTYGKSEYGFIEGPSKFRVYPLINLVSSVCTGFEVEGLSIDVVVNDAYNLVINKGIIGLVDDGVAFPVSDNDVFIDFGYHHWLKKQGTLAPETYVIDDPLKSANGSLGPYTFDLINNSSHYSSHSSNGAIALFAVPFIDGSKHGLILDYFFAVTNILRDHNYFAKRSSDVPALSIDASVIKPCPGKGSDFCATKKSVTFYVDNISVFQLFTGLIWFDPEKKGALANPNRELPINFTEAYGGFVIIMPTFVDLF